MNIQCTQQYTGLYNSRTKSNHVETNPEPGSSVRNMGENGPLSETGMLFEDEEEDIYKLAREEEDEDKMANYDKDDSIISGPSSSSGRIYDRTTVLIEQDPIRLDEEGEEEGMTFLPEGEGDVDEGSLAFMVDPDGMSQGYIHHTISPDQIQFIINPGSTPMPRNIEGATLTLHSECPETKQRQDVTALLLQDVVKCSSVSRVQQILQSRKDVKELDEGDCTSENLESFGLEPSPQPADSDLCAHPAFPQPPPSTSSSSCSITTPVLETQAPPTALPSQPALPPTVSSSLLTPPFPSAPSTSSNSPEASAPSTPSVSQHYVASPSSTQPVPPPSAPSVCSTAAVTTEVTVAATHTVPLAPPPPTITIAPTLGLQPSIVMSDHNLQWILSSAASAQQNPEQQGPKVEKVFFTTAIPVGGHSGNAVQQIGLSLPVIIIKQEESCQCQCACRDSAKDRSAASSLQDSKNTSPPPPPRPPPPPPLPPITPEASPSCCPSKKSPIVPHAPPLPDNLSTPVTPNPTTEGLAIVDVSDLLSPDTTANIEALLMITDEFSMADGGSNNAP
ncbi:metal regulatory transcription factor 1-like [Xyrauchen texanus]|uniref:metal regulatory transcription factor 1-like n=1 Tax=Xyrauchen texanus TaxID=154827 RepID=UPI00224201A1|nr:metal regulatory transcription factor 1-like [Xyrauchen texanus]